MEFNELMILLFITVGMIFYWGISLSIGFRIVYYCSLFFYFYELLHSFSFQMNEWFLFLLSPNILITSLMILGMILFNQYDTNRSFIAGGLVVVAVIALFFIPLKSTLYSILFALFIVYICERMTIWVLQAPDLMKALLAIVFPVTLLFLHTNMITIKIFSILLGTGIAYLFHQIQVQMQISDRLPSKLKAVSLGLIILLLLVSTDFFTSTIFWTSIIYFLIGFVGIYITPILFIKFSIYKHRTGHFV